MDKELYSVEEIETNLNIHNWVCEFGFLFFFFFFFLKE